MRTNIKQMASLTLPLGPQSRESLLTLVVDVDVKTLGINIQQVRDCCPRTVTTQTD